MKYYNYIYRSKLVSSKLDRPIVKPLKKCKQDN